MTAAVEGGDWSASHPTRTLPPGKDPVPIVQEVEWALGPVWTGEKSRPTGIRTSDRPARSSVAILTELPGPYTEYYTSLNPQGPTIIIRELISNNIPRK